ncbi:MAG: hypothetical protein AB1420_15855 [Bacillota bacterium]
MKKISIEKIIEMIEECKKQNPYPKHVFGEPTKKEYQKMRKAFENANLIPDRFFGSWGREVWDNCIERLKREISEKHAKTLE